MVRTSRCTGLMPLVGPDALPAGNNREAVSCGMEFEHLARSIFYPVHSSNSEKAKEWSREAGNRWSYSEHLVLWGPLLALVVVRRTRGGTSCQERGTPAFS